MAISSLDTHIRDKMEYQCTLLKLVACAKSELYQIKIKLN